MEPWGTSHWPMVATLSPSAYSTIADRFEKREVLDQSLERIPWHRAGQPEEIARAILYLASDDASFLTGVSLDVDGGRNI